MVSWSHAGSRVESASCSLYLSISGILPARYWKKVTWPDEDKEVLVKLGLAGPLPRTW